MNPDLIRSLDPELRLPITELMGKFVSLKDIPAARVAEGKMMEALKAQAPVVRRVEVEVRLVPGPEGAPDVTVRIYRPEGRKAVLPALLWIHGGGYVLGSVEYEDATCAQLAAEADCVTVAVEYRLAPENPFPAPLEDCYAALRWMAASVGELGIDRSRIAIGGASAGGGLSAGLALLARDRGEVDIVFQLLVYPMLDDRNAALASEVLPDAVFWTRENNLVAWRSYLGREPGGGRDIGLCIGLQGGRAGRTTPGVCHRRRPRPACRRGHRLCPQTHQSRRPDRASRLPGRLSQSRHARAAGGYLETVHFRFGPGLETGPASRAVGRGMPLILAGRSVPSGSVPRRGVRAGADVQDQGKSHSRPSSPLWTRPLSPLGLTVLFAGKALTS